MLSFYYKFAQPILVYATTRDQISYLERVLGKPESYSTNVAQEVVKDMQTATHYPPKLSEVPTGAELAVLVLELIGSISEKKEERSTDESK